MQTFLTVIHVIASIFLILVVLLQSGRGGGVGAGLAGASGQIFGGRGASTFLSRLTSIGAVVFFLTSLTLSMLSSRHRSVLLRHGNTTPAAATALDPNADEAEDPEEDAADRVKAGAVKAGDAKAPPATKPDTPAGTPPGVPEAPAQ